MMIRKQQGFTLVECLICIILISAIGMASMYVVNGYYKQTFARDSQLKEAVKNMNTIEKLKADVHTMNQLYLFSQSNNIRIISVGIGEVNLVQKPNGEIDVIKISDENFGFSDRLKSYYKLFRIEVGGDIPNTKLITILRLESDNGA